MSLSTIMRSWCKNFKDNCTFRSSTLANLKKGARMLVSSHASYRQQVIRAKRENVKEKVKSLVDYYRYERTEAAVALTNMRANF